MKTFTDLARDHQLELKKLEGRFATKAARLGFVKGALVQNKDGIFRVTRLFHRGNMAMYGVKLRKDGTFGTHEHYVSDWHGVWLYREAA